MCALHHNTAWELCWSRRSSPRNPPTLTRESRHAPGCSRNTPPCEAAAESRGTRARRALDRASSGINQDRRWAPPRKPCGPTSAARFRRRWISCSRCPASPARRANVVLGSWFKESDRRGGRHARHRISRRWEFTKNNDPQKTGPGGRIIPQDRWILYSHQVSHHGRGLVCSSESRSVPICPIEPPRSRAEDKNLDDRGKCTRARRPRTQQYAGEVSSPLRG